MSEEFDTFMIEDVRSLLFGAGGPGLDLAALSIQRGRDHGLPSYNRMRVALGLEARASFDQITNDDALAARLSAAYDGDISRLDLLVGGLAEDSVGGGMMGETFRAVMIDQFTRLRDGDRFWSEGRGFGDVELEELWDTTLSDVILRNSDVAELQDNAFLAYARRAGGAGADTLSGGAGRNLLIGADGDDTLIGGRREDHLDSGAGADTLSGARGSDVLEAGAVAMFSAAVAARTASMAGAAETNCPADAAGTTSTAGAAGICWKAAAARTSCMAAMAGMSSCSSKAAARAET